jgi:calcium binding protein 39
VGVAGGCDFILLLQLLGELLLDRHNFTIMTRYISNPENLKLMMTMLRDKSRNITFEAFHVFKVHRGLGPRRLHLDCRV